MRFILLMSVFLVACSSPEPKVVPTDVLTKSEMTAVLTDVHLLKGKIAVWRMKQQVSQLQEDSLFQLLYAEHQITKAVFDSSMAYYTLEESAALEAIYTEVVEELQKQEADLGN